MNELKIKIKEIDRGLNQIEKEKKELLNKLKELKHKEQAEIPKVSLRVIKEKYLVANTRVADKVYSVYIGSKEPYSNWRTSKALKRKAVEKMKDKLKNLDIQ